MIVCPTVLYNKAHQGHPCLWSDLRVYILVPRSRLHDYFRDICSIFRGEPTLYIQQDMSAKKALTEKQDMLSKLAVSNRHAQ